MADELNTPSHRWYSPRNGIALSPGDFNRDLILDSGIQKLDAWTNSQPWGNPFPLLFASGEPGAWYDPSDISTLFQDAAGTIPVTAAGQPVGRINDKSGRGNHATQSAAASRPTYQIDANRLPCLAFDGVDDFLITPTITPNTDKMQIFAGVRKLSDAATGSLVEFSAAVTANSGTFALLAPIGGSSSYQYLSRGTSSRTVTGSTYAAPDTAVLTGLGDISGDRSVLRIDGVELPPNLVDQGTGNYLPYPVYIGRRAGTSLPFSGNIYALIVRFGANLSNAQVTSGEAWVNAKTGAY